MAEKRYHKLIQLYRVIYLLLGIGAIVLGVIFWISTMSFSAVQLILVSIITLAAATHNLYYRYAINIFKRKITVTYSAKNERELVYSLALGLYSVVITVLVFTSAFILLRVWGLSSVVTVGLILIEIALFGGLGYVGVVQLRKNMEWVQTQDQ